MTDRKRPVTIFVAILAVLMVSLSSAYQSSVFASSTPTVILGCGLTGDTPSHVIIFYKLNNQDALNKYLSNAYYNPSSPQYHNFISSSTFASLYGPSSSVVKQIGKLLDSNHLSILQNSPVLTEATGTTDAVNDFLNELSSSPPALQSAVTVAECIPQGFFTASSHTPSYSTNMVKVPQSGLAQMVANATSINPGQPPIFIKVHEFQIWLPYGLQLIYDELPMLNNGHTGSGLTIGIVDAFGDFNFTLANNLKYSSTACNDLTTFNKIFNLQNSNCNVIYPAGPVQLTSANIGSAFGWSFETALDIEYAHTMAPGANILLAASPTAGDDLYASIEYMVNKQLVNYISLSWGLYEDLFFLQGLSPQLLYAYDEIFMQAAAEGIGIFVSSGDTGAFDILWPSIIPGGVNEPSVSSPANDPWVTAVGGTTLRSSIDGNRISRVESAWSWLNYSFLGGFAGTGGGYSMFFRETAGQKLINIKYSPSSVYEPDLGIVFKTVGSRGVPDVAADANVATGVLLVLNGSLQPYIIGGTSLSSPLSAGMTTTLQSYKGNWVIGNLAPSIYMLYHKSPSTFYVAQSSFTFNQLMNGVPGAMFKTTSGQNGVYVVTPGQWNAVDGLGQLNVYGLSQLI